MLDSTTTWHICSSVYHQNETLQPTILGFPHDSSCSSVPLQVGLAARMWKHLVFRSKCGETTRSSESHCGLGYSRWVQNWNLTKTLSLAKVLEKSSASPTGNFLGANLEIPLQPGPHPPKRKHQVLPFQQPFRTSLAAPWLSWERSSTFKAWETVPRAWHQAYTCTDYYLLNMRSAKLATCIKTMRSFIL